MGCSVNIDYDGGINTIVFDSQIIISRHTCDSKNDLVSVALAKIINKIIAKVVQENKSIRAALCNARITKISPHMIGCVGSADQDVIAGLNMCFLIEIKLAF